MCDERRACIQATAGKSDVLLSQGNHLQCGRPGFNPWVGKVPWRRDRLPTPVFLGLSCGSADKESTCSAGDLGLVPGLRRCPGERKGYPLLYSGLENSMDYIVHGVTRGWTRLSDFKKRERESRVTKYLLCPRLAHMPQKTILFKNLPLVRFSKI